MVFWLAVILLLVEMLCFSAVVMPGCLINLFLANFWLTVSNAPSKHFYFSLPTAVKHVLADFCNAPSVRL